MNIRRIVFAVVLLLATSSVAWAEKEAYILGIGEEVELCQNVLALFNADRKQPEGIRYDKHTMFVNWDVVTLDGAVSEDLTQKQFDIDNDGSDDLVLRSSVDRGQVPLDRIYVFPVNSKILKELRPADYRALNHQTDKIDLSDTSYPLKPLPKFKGMQLPRTLPGFERLEPFIFGKTTYTSMTNLDEQYVLIAKYRKPEHLEVVCYLQDPSELRR